MNIIIPMAGMGKRLRPHTLVTPKPLFKIAGKTIVERLVKKINDVTEKNIEKIGFVTGNFGTDTEKNLLRLADSFNSDGKIFIQSKPLGTAHAVYCADEFLSGEVIVAFADTLFDASFQIDKDADAVIFTKKVENPSAYGVVKLEKDNIISGFVEKPQKFVSDLAIIGIYYFKNGEVLADKIRYLLNNKLKVNGEYQLTDALQLMLDDGYVFKAQVVDGWYDCGNKDLILSTSKVILDQSGNFVHKEVKINNSVLQEPYYIGRGAVVENSVLKGYVIIEDNAKIKNSILENVIVMQGAELDSIYLKNSIIGEFSEVSSNPKDLSLGDYSKIKL